MKSTVFYRLYKIFDQFLGALLNSWTMLRPNETFDFLAAALVIGCVGSRFIFVISVFMTSLFQN